MVTTPEIERDVLRDRIDALERLVLAQGRMIEKLSGVVSELADALRLVAAHTGTTVKGDPTAHDGGR